MALRKITLRMLRRAGACKYQLALFQKHYPNGATPTIATCRKAARLGMDIWWAADNLLSLQRYHEFFDNASGPLRCYIAADAFSMAWKKHSADLDSADLDAVR